MARNYQSVKFLAKVKVEIDISTRTAFFSLPDFGFPKKKAEAVAEWDTIDINKDYLLSPNEVWGIVELICESEEGNEKNGNKITIAAIFGYN